MAFSKPLYETSFDLKGSFFQGTVVDNSDSEAQKNRVKVRVDTMTDDASGIPDDDLPWYMVMAPAGVGNSSANVPPVSSRVLVQFPDGDVYNGVVVSVLNQKSAT